MTDYDLFGDPIIVPDDTPELRAATDQERRQLNPNSYGRRLTERLAAIAATGVNPLVSTRGPSDRTCGECVHRELRGGHAKAYPKCALGPATRGPKTDVRKSWPACHRFEEIP